MSKELSVQELEKLWGGALPMIEPVYHRLGSDFVGGRKQLAPYVIKWFYTLDEAELVLLLPGDAASVSAKAGISETEAADKLRSLASRARILKTETGYERFTNLGLFKDFLFILPNFIEECGVTGARLILAWDEYGDFYDKEVADNSAPNHMMRIVPKWESIKDVPGVMPCENMPEMLLSDLENLVFTRCPCRASTSLAKYGYYKTDMCRTGLEDSLDPNEGICLMSDWRGKYFKDVFGMKSHTREEAINKIKQVEAADTYYCARNCRGVKQICNCCDCCGCGLRTSFDKENKDWFAKSRFVAFIEDEDACVGCGLCESICPFEKSVHLDDGKASVDAERCHGCGVCVVKCPTKALQMKLTRPASHIPESWIIDNLNGGSDPNADSKEA